MIPAHAQTDLHACEYNTQHQTLLRPSDAVQDHRDCNGNFHDAKGPQLRSKSGSSALSRAERYCALRTYYVMGHVVHSASPNIHASLSKKERKKKERKKEGILKRVPTSLGVAGKRTSRISAGLLKRQNRFPLRFLTLLLHLQSKLNGD